MNMITEIIIKYRSGERIRTATQDDVAEAIQRSRSGFIAIETLYENCLLINMAEVEFISLSDKEEPEDVQQSHPARQDNE